MWKIHHLSEYQVGTSHTTFLGQNLVGNPEKESKIQNLEPFSHFQPFFLQRKWPKMANFQNRSYKLENIHLKSFEGAES